MTKLMPWVGGKAQLMWAIQMLLPTHYKTLVDVFGGSGIITMNTSVPSGCLQIYNDLNHDLYNLLFCAKERPLELVRELGFLPINAHDEFDVLQRQLQGEDFTMEYMERQLDLTEVFFEPPQAEVVRQLLEDSLPDAFGIDYKAPASDYSRLTGTGDSGVAERVHRTIRMAVESGRFLDVRTTVHRELLSPEMLAQMHRELRGLGVKRWMLQQFNPVEVIDDELPEKPTYSDAELVRIARSLGEDVLVRGLTGRIISRD